MNYLAHLYLAGIQPDALVGNLMGDFVKGSDLDDLEPILRRGVILHRRIDSYTDAHAVVLQSKRRIQPPFRRYAGIVVDLFYDHFLARDWDEYASIPLSAFAEHVYQVLQGRLPQLPQRMQRSVRYMLANDLLSSYRQLDGIARALRGIEGRLQRPSRLGESIAELEREYDALGRDFALFFPELIECVVQSPYTADRRDAVMVRQA